MYNDILLSVFLTLYTVLVLLSTKYLYKYSKKKGLDHKDAVYYNRKVVHIFAGGVVALFVPFYQSPFFPLIAGFLLGLVTYLSHLKGDTLYWFQNKKDVNDVSFCLMWGLSIFVLWIIFDNPWLAILPAVFIAFGDGVTGIIRNMFLGNRSKHYIGNIFMAIVCIPLGYYLGGLAGIALWGVLAAIVSSIVERYEYGPIDDNILIAVSSTLVLLLRYYLP